MKTSAAATSAGDAMTALHRIVVQGGLKRGLGDPRHQFSGGEVVTFLGHLDALGINLPASFGAPLSALADRYERVSRLATKPAAFTLDDVDADDYEHRFRDYVLAGIAAAHAVDYVKRSCEALDAEARPLIRRSLRAATDDLNAVYVEHAKDYHHHDDARVSGAERDRRTALHNHIARAHGFILDQGPQPPGGFHDDTAAVWNLMFEWTPAAWQKLVRDSLPALQSRGNMYDFAVQCGATPHLAYSYAAATTAAHTLYYEKRKR